MKNFDDLFDLVREHPVRKVAVAVAQDHTVKVEYTLLEKVPVERRKVA